MSRFSDVFNAVYDAGVVEAHAVDYGLFGQQSEQAGLGITFLGSRRDRANFDKSKAETPERINRIAFFVQSRSKPDAVRKGEAHHFDRRAS